MNARPSMNKYSLLATSLAFALSAHAGLTDLSTIPLSTYYAPSSVDVKPNILFVLDDSGSMDWDGMPDQAAWYISNNTEYRPNNYNSSVDSGMPPYMRYNAAFNGVAYNPAIRYQPPIKYNSDGTQNTTTYPSMTGVSTATGGNASATSGSPNWKAVKNDGYGVQSTSTSDLTTNAYTYVVVPGEYCDNPDLRTCTTSTAPTGNYTYPALMRWCTTAALTTCRATWDSGNAYPRMPAPRITTITVSGSSSTSVSGITVGGLQIISATTSSDTSSSIVASRIASAINNCTNGKTGNCTTVGYSATVSGSVVTIYAPSATTDTPSITLSSGSMTFTTSAFARSNVPLPYWRDTTPSTNQSSSTIPGENLRHTIAPYVTSYPYPGSATKASGRTDCASTTCTYAEEMTNYANWYAYYRTRMQLMKTAASRAFAGIDSTTDIAANVSRFRVGYMSLNNNTGTDFLNLDEFKTSQKSNWYTKLFAANPSSGTPLRAALSKAGRLYAGKYNGSTLNGVTVTDPLQYSCQQNFTILSTDGFWNGAAGYKLDGSTAVGNQDGAMAAPYNDGGAATIEKRTSTLQTRTETQKAEKGTLQTISYQLQTRTSQLQESTSTLQQSTSTLQQRTSSPQQSTSTLQQRTSTLQTRTSSNSGSTWTSWSNTSSCNPDTSGSSRRDCQYTAWSGWSNVSSCTPAAQDTSGTWSVGTAVECQYTAWSGWSDTSSCTPVSQDTSGTWSVGTATQCQYGSWGAWSNVASCTPAAQATSGTRNTATECQYTAWSTPSNVSSCTPVAQDTSGTWSVGTATQCQYTSWSTPADVSSCTTVAQDTSGTWSVPTAKQCSYSAWGSWANTGSCTAAAQSASSPYSTALARECQTATLGTSNTSSCTVSSPDGSGSSTGCQYAWAALAVTQTCSPAYVANDYTNATVYRNCAISGTTWNNTSSCTIGDWSVSGTRTGCQYSAWSSWSTVSSCTAVAQSASSPYSVGTAVECQTGSVSGGTSDTLSDVAAYYYNNDLRNSDVSAGTGTCTGPTIAPATTANDLCENDVAPNDRDVATWQHMTTFTLGLGAQGKMLFSPTYWTDTSGDFYWLKTGTTADPANGVCSWISSGNKCVWSTPSSDSPANIDDLWHAAINGRGSYFSATDPSSLASSLSSTLSEIAAVPRAGTAAAAASSNPNISTTDNYIFSSYYKSIEWYGDLYRQRLDKTTQSLSAGQDWSASVMLDCATTTWHANTSYVAGAVYRNGSSCYLVKEDYTSGSVFDSTDVDKTILAVYAPASCTAWAANISYAIGDLFSAGGVCRYVIKAYTSGTSYGATDTQNSNAAYASGAPTSRTIYTKGGSGLTPFLWANLSSAQQAYFIKPTLSYVAGPPSTGLSQFCSSGSNCLSTSAQDNTTVATGGAAGEALVKYLAGDRSNEGTFFRARKHVLGDIVSSEARYVKAPPRNYTDSGYKDFKTLKATREGVVYVASNDGMLHAFNAESGKEMWAYIPALVLPELYRLADMKYSQNHRYYTDGTPETGDICPTAPTTACTASQWKTILVGGLNLGGKGYYAMDITDPANPILLWEFTDANMGYTYGNPIITKLKTGQWVVILSSGYNNADGIGRLYVLDAYTGAQVLTPISTGTGADAGSPGATNPSGLARISAPATSPDSDRTALSVYGGDMLGNLWRFDINGDIGTSGNDAQLLVTFKDAGGNRQPITAKPEVALVSGHTVVYVGTGSYLGLTDVGSTTSQTMYAVKDSMGSTTLGNPRISGSNFVQQTMTETTCVNESSCTPGEKIRKITSYNNVDWATKNGWYVDFLTAGERGNTDPSLVQGTLAFTTNTPNQASAQPCGAQAEDTSAAWFYSLNYTNGGPVSGYDNVISISLGNVIATRPVIVRLPDGTVLALIRTSGSGTTGGTTAGAGSGLPPLCVGDDCTGSGGTKVKNVFVAPPNVSLRRASWREITNE